LTASLGHGKGRCDIIILNPNKSGHIVDKAWLNGKALTVINGQVTLARDLAKGRLELWLI
jgi:hypothetical protein